jgi:hypothetical protein
MKKLILSLTIVSILSFSCKRSEDDPKDPINPNENELITTFQLVLTEDGTSNVSTFTFRDEDGDGGNEPSDFDTIRLSTNKTYHGEIFLLDESKSPADTISIEVAEEAEEHQFFYSTSGISGLSVSYSSGDVDANGVPLGLFPEIVTGANTGIGTITFVLKHQETDKPTSGSGNSSLGSTDIEIAFPTKITN